jgi:hypothetical protein
MLPAATELLWKRLEHEPLLAGWHLIGGTALSLTIEHRQSEDLDFVWPGQGLLPVPVIGHLVKQLVAEGWHLERDDDPRADQEFRNAGMNLHDHQQNFVASTAAGNVKLTFFSPDLPLCVLLPKSESATVIIPPLSLLFQSKALVACSRSALRDWVDPFVKWNSGGNPVVAGKESGSPVPQVFYQQQRLCT